MFRAGSSAIGEPPHTVLRSTVGTVRHMKHRDQMPESRHSGIARSIRMQTLVSITTRRIEGVNATSRP